jgi:hypothetical protein
LMGSVDIDAVKPIIECSEMFRAKCVNQAQIQTEATQSAIPPWKILRHLLHFNKIVAECTNTQAA